MHIYDYWATLAGLTRKQVKERIYRSLFATQESVDGMVIDNARAAGAEEREYFLKESTGGDFGGAEVIIRKDSKT